ncbi:anaphase-promoting complex subunit cdc20-like [Schistocerca gregaria]|uniref:anaphase-promoting complex subunit cdc20-like n=1 Tax=Schistocerca gregaria TaxID=7010 RepID=UPI00211E79B0|nr:anaphase-promoting complex subunit cdc20-like [Schistocerca gregaria]
MNEVINPSSCAVGDRFIPNRSSMDTCIAQYNLTKENEGNVQVSCSLKQLHDTLAESLFSSTTSIEQCKIMCLKNKAPEPRAGYENRLKVLYSQNLDHSSVSRYNTRHIPSQAEKILDAPDVLDDYYLNLLDWSKDNLLAVALGSAVYIWKAQTGEIIQLCDQGSSKVTSVSWAQGGQYLAVGTESCDVMLWDVRATKLLRNMDGHQARVSALSWNGSTLSSAGRDCLILNHDVRVQHHLISTLQGHTQEVCGLAWSPDGSQLASGANDNVMNIWDTSDLSRARYTITEHQAAIKALAWCPWSANTLASGGGTADPCIRFWNTSSGACLNTINTGAQICALQWSSHYKEIASSHGWKNNICIWKYPSMVKCAELTGHTSRVLNMSQSPDGTTLVSIAGDETLRFWKVWSLPSGAGSSKAAAKTQTGIPTRGSTISKIR